LSADSPGPIVDSLDFVTLYLSKPIPCAAAMGTVGAVLCHCLYAWGVSYGVDERGQLDVAEGGAEPLGPLNLLNVTESEARRERERQRRMEKLNRVVRTILREIDEYGLLRRPSWDGIRALLLILPLTEGEQLQTTVSMEALTLQAFRLRLSNRRCTRRLCLRYSFSAPPPALVMTASP
jgi:hypothetical protein